MTEDLLSTLEDTPNLPWDELHEAVIEKALPTTGFRNGKKMSFLKFSFRTINAYHTFKRHLNGLYPAPTKKEIDAGIYRNEYIVCEADIPEEMKCATTRGVPFCYWVRLKKGTYELSEAEDPISRCQHTFHTREIQWAKSIETVAPAQVSSIDIEAVRDDGADAMPHPDNARDCIASVGETIQPTDQSASKQVFIFAWGKPVAVPKDPTLHIYLYKTEQLMMSNWVKWRRCRYVSPDAIIGWNILGFDNGYIYERMQKMAGIEKDDFDWGKICGLTTKGRPMEIASKAIAHSKYFMTPISGTIQIDCMVVYSRDVTLRLDSYSLETVSRHFLKRGKKDVHHSEIRGLFYNDDPAKKLLLLDYNGQDTKLVKELFDFSGLWAKLVNVCRVNKVPMDLLCTRGQQIRVFGGYVTCISLVHLIDSSQILLETDGEWLRLLATPLSPRVGWSHL